MSDFSAPEENISIDQGDDETFVITRENSDGTAKDISNFTFWLTIKNSRSDADSDAVIQKKVTNHTAPTNGETEIDLTTSDTDGLSGGYEYDIQEKTGGGAINTLMQGTLHFSLDVTDSTS